MKYIRRQQTEKLRNPTIMSASQFFPLAFLLSSAMVGSDSSSLFTVNCKAFVNIINEAREKKGV